MAHRTNTPDYDEEKGCLCPDRGGGGRQYGHARRDVAAGARGASLCGRVGLRARPRPHSGVGVGEHFRDLDLPDVSRFDALPFDESGLETQGRVPYPRPYFHLRRHRRKLYADRAVGDRRVAGRLHHDPAVGDGAVRHLLQVAFAQDDSRPQPDDLSGHGVDDRIFHAAFRAAGVDAAAGADRRGRRALYARRVVLRPAGIPLPPHGLAPADQSGCGGPFYGNRVFSVLSAGSTVKRPET